MYFVLNMEVSSSKRLKYTERIGKLAFGAKKVCFILSFFCLIQSVLYQRFHYNSESNKVAGNLTEATM